MRVVLFLLKCVVGLLAAVGFLVVGGIAAMVLFWDRVEPLATRAKDVPAAAVLTLDLAPGVAEARADNPLARASLGRLVVLRETVEALEAAGRDPRVHGVIARLGRGDVGLAQAQELREAVADFRATGKFAHAFAESFGEGGHGTIHYYLASAFDRVWMQPSGDLYLTGFLLESPFLREALDELGVTARVAQREEYKGAMSFATETDLPEPQRRNLQRLLDSWLEQVTAGIAQTRTLAPDVVRALVDRAPFDAAAALEAGLVDALGYRDQAEAAAVEAAGGEAELFALHDYRRRSAAEAPEEGPVVALVFGLGPVVLADSENDPVFGRLAMGADTVAAALEDAVEDPEVRAILFRIDSPGGSYVASDVIWRAVDRARAAGKPVIATMGDVAASGGYFAAAPATRIVAHPGTVTGSIGVVAGKLVLSGLWRNLGIGWDGVKAGDNADFWSPNRDFSEAGWERLQGAMDRTYEDFLTKVAQGRGLARAAVLDAAKGQVWSGADAKERGLVDALGGYARALALAREAAGIAPGAPVRVREFPKPRDPFQALLEEALEGDLETPVLRALARVAAALAPLVEAAERLTGDGRGPALRAPDLRPAQ